MTTILHLATTPISLDWLLGDQLEAFDAAGYDVVTASAPGSHARGLAERSIMHHSLPSFTRDFDLGSDVRAARDLRALVREVQPDIIHTHNPKPGVFGRVIGKWTKVPIVVNTVHGLYAQRQDRLTKRGLVYGLERLAAAHSDAELVQNIEDLETLRSLGVPDERLHLLGNGIDLDSFTPDSKNARDGRCIRVQLGIGQNIPIVGIVGRLVWEKGYREFFHAIEIVRRNIGDREMAVVVVGPDEQGHPDAIPQAELARIGNELGVHFLGERRDITSVMAALDIFVLPSHREGFPRAAMEASAMSVPVIASDIRGCRQVVDNDVTGILVPARNPERLALAIERLVREPGVRERMGRRARQKALSEFDQRSVIEITLGVYKSLLEERGMDVPDRRDTDQTSLYLDSIDLVEREASNRSEAASAAAVPSELRSA